MAGIALIALGVTCGFDAPLLGMMIYRVTIALFLSYGGFVGSFDGRIL